MVGGVADQLLIHPLRPARGGLLAHPAQAPRHARHRGLIVVVGREHAVQARVSDRHVVGLEVVVHRDLPVDVPHIGADRRERHHVLEAVGRQLLGERAPGLGHGRRVARETHEDESECGIDAHRAQAMRRAVEAREALAHRHADQAPILAIAPAVIRAGDRGRAGARAVEDAGAAVPAYVVKCLDRAVLVAQDKHAFRAEIESLVVAGARDGIDVTDDLPARQQHALDLEPRQFGVTVHPGGQGMPLAAGAVAVERDGGRTLHGGISNSVI